MPAYLIGAVDVSRSLMVGRVWPEGRGSGGEAWGTVFGARREDGGQGRNSAVIKGEGRY